MTREMDLSRQRRGVVLVVLWATSFLTSVDTSAHSIAVGTLLQQLGDRPVMRTSVWIPKAHVLGFAALLMIGGALTDRFGAKRVLVGGYLLYIGGTAAELALVTTSIPLIVIRVIMGAGAAVMIPATLSILTTIGRSVLERAKTVTVWAGCCAAGVTVVPLICGLILNHVWWPRVVAALGAIAVLSLIGVVVFVPATPADRTAAVDWPTIGTVTLGFGLVMFALVQAPDWGWSAPAVVATMVAGVALLVWSAIRRRGGSLPHDFFLRADTRVRPAMYALVGAIMALFGSVFLIVQYLQAVRGHTPIVAGWLLFLPACGATVIGVKVGSELQRRFGIPATLVVGLTAMLNGLATGLPADAKGELGPIVAMVTVVSVGFAVVLRVALGTMSAALPLARNGIAWAATATAIPFGGLLGVAIVGSLVDRGYHDHLVMPAKVPSHDGAVVSANSVGRGVAVATSAGERVADAVQNAFLAGYRHGLLATIAVVAVMVVAILVSAARSAKSTVSR
ncbi:MFS transporter [Nocardia sp. NPDC051570]|uniref:MFS transporter n=1 Tax=Nocardia sp. NPDC051570 TaxID=3364324 RepID=UPI00379CE610